MGIGSVTLAGVWIFPVRVLDFSAMADGMSDRGGDRPVAPAGPSLPEGRLRRSHACLVVQQGAEIGRDFRLRRHGMVIGRSPEADIRLLDGRVSRAHARIAPSGGLLAEDGAYVLEDLQSTNRTFVNSDPIGRVTLAHGDRVQIGDTVLEFVVLDEVEASIHARIRDRIEYDPLTGLLTEGSLHLALKAELDRCLRYDLPLAVLVMDLDNIRSVNGTDAHPTGIHVLGEVGRLIHQTIRREDVCARYGGKGFLGYLSETRAVGGVAAAQRIRSAIEAHPFTLGGQPTRVTISIGVAAAPPDGLNVGSLVEAADAALNRARRAGRNRVCIAERSG